MSVTKNAGDKPKASRNRRKKGKISFDKEIVTKADREQFQSEPVQEGNATVPAKTEHKKFKHKSAINEEESVQIKKVKKGKNQKNIDSEIHLHEDQPEEDHSSVNEDEDQEVDISQAENLIKNPKDKESKRALKKKKVEILKSEQRLKHELLMQQNCLSYLSLWKTGPSEWKFKKQLQVWLIKNLFDAVKVPEEFWVIAVEYFGKSQGAARKTLKNECIKIMDAQNSEESNVDAIKLQRAQDLLENLRK